MAINFAKMLEADISKERGGTPTKRLPAGRFQAAVTKFAQNRFDSGAEALSVDYLVTDGDEAGTTITQNIFTRSGVAKGNQDLPYGYSDIRRLLLTLGVDNDKIKTFKIPKLDDGKGIGDLVKLIGKSVTITVELKERKSGKAAGKSFPEVINVEPAEQASEEEVA